MRNESRLVYNQYLARQAELNGIDVSTVREGKNFTIDPSVQQTLETRLQENVGFLRQINVVPVREMSGEKLGLGISGPIASRTNTSANARVPVDLSTMDERGYQCAKTDSDTFVPYAKIDLWAKFPDFQVRMRDNVIVRQGLDRIMIGWHGVSVAAATNKVTYPLGQDVNKGWLQYLREVAPSHVISEGSEEDEIRVGAAVGRDYFNMDALVKDMVFTMLPQWGAEDPNLVCILGRGLLHDKYFPMVNNDQAPTEQLAADVITSKKQVGGLPAVTVPYFPADSIMVTPLDNLSIYYQEGGRRRTIQDNPSRDRIDTFESSNDAYVVEDPERACLIENITLDWEPPVEP